MRIGVLALQGDFGEHAKILAHIGAEPVEVRLPQHLEGLDGLIIPGGESTTIGKIAQQQVFPGNRWDGVRHASSSTPACSRANERTWRYRR